MAGRTFRSALASRSGRSSPSAGDGMDGVLAGASTVESSSAAILMPSAAERFIATPRSFTEIIEDSLPRTAHSERADLRIAVRTGLAQPQVTDILAHLEATRERPKASPALIAGQALTGALNRAYAGNRGFSGGERAFAGRASSVPRSGGFSGSPGGQSHGFSSHGGSGGSHGGGHFSGGHASGGHSSGGHSGGGHSGGGHGGKR